MPPSLPKAGFELRPPRPYSLARTADRFAFLDEGVNVFADGVYRRLIEVGGKPLLVAVEQRGTPAKATLRVRLTGQPARTRAARDAATELCARALGTDTDVRPFYRAFRDDPILGASIARERGLRIAGSLDAWETLVSAVLAQQVNLRFAYSIRRELAQKFGRRARIGGQTYVTFPAPRRIARLSEAELRGFRLSGSKAGTLSRLAKAFADGELSDASLRSLSDDEVIERLVEIKGVGRWTADVALVRGLGRPDAFPAGDLAVVKYLAQGLLGRRKPSSEKEMRRFAEGWAPHRSLALIYAYAELAYRRAA